MSTKILSFTVGLPVADLNSAVEWYRRLPGEVEEVNPAAGVWEFQIISSVWLLLFETEPQDSNPAVVRLETENIAASRMIAVSLGTDVGEIETVPEAVRYFEFQDPFDNKLTFYELLRYPCPTRRSSGWACLRFAAASRRLSSGVLMNAAN